MNTTGWSAESVEALRDTFERGELKLLQDEIKGIARPANDMLKALGSDKRMILDIDDLGDVFGIELVALRKDLRRLPDLLIRFGFVAVPAKSEVGWAWNTGPDYFQFQ